jgi:hypothetical protein
MDPSPGTFSWMILFLMLLMLGASMGMFFMLVRRWTTQRSWISLLDWAKSNRFRVLHTDVFAIPPLAVLANRKLADLQIRLCLGDGRTTIAQLNTSDARWNLLLIQIESKWKPTGLRPSHQAASICDEFELPSYPRMGGNARFVVCGVDAAPARRLSKSYVPALLPQDIGLLIHEQHVILDFSSRPFDPIEFGRVLALGTQIIAHLPAA